MIHPTNNKSISQKILWHLEVGVGAVFISIIFSLILIKEVFHSQFPNMLVMTFAQLEIFIWLGILFFQSIKSDDPKYIRKMVVRLLLFYSVVLAIAFIMFLLMYTFHFIRNGFDFSLFFTGMKELEFKSILFATLIGFAFGALFFFYAQWSEAVKRAQKLKEEKLVFQYETLKSQVNPHFLFNSLNSLSSLVSNDPDMAEKFVQKLSSIYRYILENKEEELVPLLTELKFVNNYFYLQKIRDEEKIELKIEIGETKNVQVLPVSLQLLVENALKHNSATRKQPLKIVIHFEGIDKLVVRNNLQKKTQLASSSKIGLKNLNERSRLILNHEIEVLETDDEFIVKLPVKTDVK